MSKLDSYLTDNSSQEDADYAFEQAAESLRLAIKGCGNDPMALAQLLCEVMGDDAAADVLTEYLEGDTTRLNDAIVEWNA